jgi:hypothetical protein
MCFVGVNLLLLGIGLLSEHTALSVFGWFYSVVAVSGATFAIFALLVYFIVRSQEKGKDVLSLPKEYLKAKKQRVCPIIEFVEE